MMDNILIYATKRSGHHFILLSLIKQLDCYSIHHNDLHAPSFIKGCVRYCGPTKDTIFHKELGGKAKHIYNWEDGDISLHEEISNSPLISGRITAIIILRDLYNMVASSIKGVSETENRLNSRIKIWKQHAKRFLEEVDFVPNAILIKYNQWFEDKSYRQCIINQLGIPFTDKGINNVPHFGGGSSFDGKHLNGRAQTMDVNNRYKKFLNNKKFHRLVNNEELARLNKQIFGFSL